MSWWRAVALLMLGWSAWFCASAPKAVHASKNAAPLEKALLWKISGNGLKKPSYLFGTIHLIPREDFQITEGTSKALDEVRRIAFEVNLQEMGGAGLFKVMTKTFMSGGKTLRDLLSEEDYAFVREQLVKRTVIPIATLERMKPMFIGSLLEGEGSGLNANGRMTSVEVELFQLARKRRLASDGLETIEYQLSLFDTIPYALQARILVEQLRQQSNMGDEFARMVALYRQKDIQAMEAMTQESLRDEPLVQETLIYRRNRDWIPLMARMMREKPTFFAVGAGHLGGSQGVIALLRKEGFRVEAVE